MYKQLWGWLNQGAGWGGGGGSGATILVTDFSGAVSRPTLGGPAGWLGPVQIDLPPDQGLQWGHQSWRRGHSQ